MAKGAGNKRTHKIVHKILYCLRGCSYFFYIYCGYNEAGRSFFKKVMVMYALKKATAAFFLRKLLSLWTQTQGVQ